MCLILVIHWYLSGNSLRQLVRHRWGLMNIYMWGDQLCIWYLNCYNSLPCNLVQFLSSKLISYFLTLACSPLTYSTSIRIIHYMLRWKEQRKMDICSQKRLKGLPINYELILKKAGSISLLVYTLFLLTICSTACKTFSPIEDEHINLS